MQKFTTFLMFAGKAEEAINFYVSQFPGSQVLSITRYGPGQGGAEGTVMQATFTLVGQQFMAIDSSVEHAFAFTPAISIFVNCESEGEIERVYRALSEGGQVFMPLGPLPFSAKFTWLADRYGVSWQLNLPRG
jgi:predicted 3-demethylubiquinone-9 3-methyltransferase (glyoxalase superfamily)